MESYAIIKATETWDEEPKYKLQRMIEAENIEEAMQTEREKEKETGVDMFPHAILVYRLVAIERRMPTVAKEFKEITKNPIGG